MFKNSSIHVVLVQMNYSNLIENCIEISEGRALIRVEVIPNSSSSGIYSLNQWRKSIQIRIRSKAEGGKANAELLELLSEIFTIPKSNLSIVSGHRSRKKRVSIEGIDSNSIISTIKDIMEATI